MNSFLLNSVYIKAIELHIENLAKVHYYRLVNLLPQMRPEDLNQTDLECGNFAVHVDTCKVELHLESNINVRSVYSWRPPKCEPSVWDLIKTRSLCMS